MNKVNNSIIIIEIEEDKKEVAYWLRVNGKKIMGEVRTKFMIENLARIVAASFEAAGVPYSRKGF